MFRKRLLAGDVLHGFYLHFLSAELVEFMGHLGFDYVLMDAEHFDYGTETV